MIATKAYLQQLDEMAAKQKEHIRKSDDALLVTRTTYYVSNDGNDKNDGLSPDSAWQSLSRVNEAELLPGDGVRFRRGDLFRGSVTAREGVGYGAFGEGEKPKIYSWECDLADPSLWKEVDAAHHIWQLTQPILDAGTLVFNHGEAHSIKLIPSYIGGRFVCREDESRPFDMRREMKRDLDLYWHFDEILTTKPSRGEDFPIPDVTSKSLGTLYLRCDKGNPAEVFSSIEALVHRPLFRIGCNNGVHIDNLCLKYTGHHAIAAGGACIKDLKVTNCEIGWIGGTIQHYFGIDPNYPQGGRGTVTRFGNGVEIYGGCKNYEVSGCYIYQVYDAGITHQVTTNGKTRVLQDIRYHHNLIEDCVYSIEYFLDMTNGDTESIMEGVDISHNFLRRSGFGWGQQRHNTHTPAHIKGWSYVNRARDYKVHHNIFDRAAYRMLHLVAKEEESCPVMYRNTYVQYLGSPLGQYGGNATAEPPVLTFDENAAHTVTTLFGDTDAEVYIIPKED